MKLSSKLIGGFFIVSMITVLVGGIGYFGSYRLGKILNKMTLEVLPEVQYLLTLEKGQEAIRTAQGFLMNPNLNSKQRQHQYDSMTAAMTDYRQTRESYQALSRTGEAENLWNRYLSASGAWEKSITLFIETSRDLDAGGILNPVALDRDIEKLKKESLVWLQKVSDLAKEGKELEDGDAAWSSLGVWLAEFQTENPRILKLIEEIQPIYGALHNNLTKIKELISDTEFTEALMSFYSNIEPVEKQLQAKLDELRKISHQAVEKYETMNDLGLTVSNNAQIDASAILKNLIQESNSKVQMDIEGAVADEKLTQGISVGGTAAGFLIAMILGWFISRSITRPVGKIIEKLTDASTKVTDGSRELASSAHSLSSGASEQAASIEETSSSLEEMSAMTKQNANNSAEASMKMTETKAVLEKVESHMNDMAEAIREITKSSEETGKIIKSIDEIAFQTNLLALNAAVEAARAGEAGAGFSVVADEVRNLAMRAAEAAKNSATLIENTIRTVRAGNELTHLTRTAFKDNMTNAAKVSELVDEIAAASQEQAQGIDQINKAVSEMGNVTQQNSAGAEESSAASEEMSAQAEQMKAMIDELVAITGGTGRKRNGARAAMGRSSKPVITDAVVVKGPKRKQIIPHLNREIKPEELLPLQ
jgi:methyl-accepting chemotaxis protein